jgi:NAD(P)-dependent dehydrogenase (short-subunit alcohol dehydrogenase family)/acyl carrier protein
MGCSVVLEAVDWTASAPEGPERCSEVVEQRLRLVQALRAHVPEHPVRLTVAVQLPSDCAGVGDGSLSGGALLGFLRAVRSERPDWAVRLVEAQRDARALAEELVADTDEDWVRLLRGQRWLPRTDVQPFATGERILMPVSGSVLITGGLGGIGLGAAHMLAAAGADHLVLVGRRQPDASQQAQLDDIRGLGCDVTVAVADVRDRERLGEIIDEAEQVAPLSGVIHAAGVLADALVDDLTPEGLGQVLAPKLEGGWHLHELTRTRDLDFFILCSSAAGFLGSPGQANHAAASTFLDALAHHRRARRLPAVSLAWGPWEEIGAVAGDHRLRRLQALGVGALTSREGLEGLHAHLHSPEAAVGILRLVPGRTPDPTRLPPALQGLLPSGPSPDPDGGAVRQEILALPATARVAAMRRHLHAIAGEVVGVDGPGLDGGLPLQDVGFDSLLGMELRDRLEKALDLSLSASLVWTFPTLNDLAAGLLERIEEECADGMSPIDVPMTELSHADESQLAEMLAAELD